MKNLNRLNFAVVDNAGMIEVVASMAQIIWHEYYHDILSQNQIKYMLETIQSEAAITKVIEDHTSIYYLLSFNEIPVGYIALNKERDSLLLSKCYILNEHRGKGYFKQILRFVEEMAMDLGMYQIDLFVNKNNKSREIYEHLGFKLLGDYQFDIGNGYLMDDFKMSKQLGKRDSNGNE